MLLLPVSVPLWIIWLTALLAATALLRLWRPVATFLTAPPEPLRSHSYYGRDHGEAKQPRLSLADRNAA